MSLRSSVFIAPALLLCVACLADAPLEEFDSEQSTDTDCVSVEGDVVLIGETLNQALPDTCFDVKGSVSVTGARGANATDLRALTGLRSAENIFIRWQEDLTSLDGLFGLRTVHGDFVAEGLLKLTDISGISGLQVVEGGFLLYQLPALTRLSTATPPQLKKVGGSFSVVQTGLEVLHGFSELMSIGGLEVWANPNLGSIFGTINSIEDVSGWISVNDNPNLVNVGNFETVRDIEMLVVEGNDNLVDVGNWTGLQNVHRSLMVGGNPKLRSLSGLGNVRSVGGFLSIGGNTILENLEELRNLATVGRTVAIGFNDSLQNLAGLRGLQEAASVEITNNGSLSDVSGIRLLASVDEVSIVDNGNISNCHASDVAEMIVFVAEQAGNQAPAITIADNGNPADPNCPQ